MAKCARVARWLNGFAVLLCLSIASCAPSENAQGTEPVPVGKGLVVSDAVFRQPVPGRYMTAAYASIHNAGDKTVVLTGFTAESVGLVELHNHIVDDDGVMKMREVGQHVLAPGQTLAMKSGGYHLMLFKVEDAVREANELSFTVTTAAGDSIAFVANAL